MNDLLPDQSLAWLIERILQSGEGVLAEEYEMVFFPGDDLFSINRRRGLPIGNLTSQIWANCYLNPFDQFVKRELKCKEYLRYVDDFLLFSNDKAQLWDWRQAIIAKLAEYRLTLHEGSATPYPVAAGIPFLGFRIYPAHRLLKRKKGIAYRRRLHHLLKTADARKIFTSIQAWKAHIAHGDTFGLARALLGG